MGITGANRTAAERMLELCGSELEQAIQLWFTDEDLQRSLSNAGPSTATTAAPAAIPGRPSLSNHPQIGREDAEGVIHIDSDDDDPMTEADFGEDGDDEVQNVARQAQEDEDAAMAKRLQEELYSGTGGAGQNVDEDGVRAPMARTTETLVGPVYGEDDDDGHAAVLEQMRRRQQARGESQAAEINLQSFMSPPEANGEYYSTTEQPLRTIRMGRKFPGCASHARLCRTQSRISPRGPFPPPARFDVAFQLGRGP